MVQLPIGTYGVAFDQANGDVVALVGASPRSSETWLWDGATWRGAQPAHQPPPPPDLVFDSALNRVVVYGGGGLWTWDGVDWTLAS